jgi:hypothetical protein
MFGANRIGMLLITVCLAIFVLVWRLGDAPSPAEPPTDSEAALSPDELRAIFNYASVPTGLTAHTDRARPVDLRTVRRGSLTPALVHGAETWLAKNFPDAKPVAPPAFNYNCHGWVIAGGRFWIEGGDFEAILHDNGYEQATEPQAGDLVVYRDAAGQVAHSGLVRYVEGGEITVESKWGALHRLMHPVAEQPFGREWAYYRPTHLTHMLEPDSGDDTRQHGIAE